MGTLVGKALVKPAWVIHAWRECAQSRFVKPLYAKGYGSALATVRNIDGVARESCLSASLPIAADSPLPFSFWLAVMPYCAALP